MTEPAPLRPLARSGAEPSYRRVFVRDLVLSCAIGVHAHEQHAPQRVRINVELMVAEEDRNLGDRIENVVSYEHIVDGVRDHHTSAVCILSSQLTVLQLRYLFSRIVNFWHCFLMRSFYSMLTGI